MTVRRKLFALAGASALARRGGSVPRQLVTLVRTAAASGEIVRDVAGDAVTWRTRKRRLLRKPARASPATAARAASVSCPERAWAREATTRSRTDDASRPT